MYNKYFTDEVCDVIINDKVVVVSNKFTGKWIKIPIECYEVIKYSVEKSIPVRNIMDIFTEEEDKVYFKKVLSNLDAIGVLDEKRYKNIKFSHIPKVVFSITNRCNLKCDYCCVDSTIDHKDNMSTEDLKLAIDNILKLNPQNIVISGGEPLIRKDFFELIDYIKYRYQGKLILSTNATLIKEQDIKYMSENIDSFEISLDGFNEESCSIIRGRGVFNKVISVIKSLKNNNVKSINLSMVTGKNNVHTIDDFYKLNYELGTNPIVRNFSGIGRGSNSIEKYLEDDTVHYIRDLDNDENISEIRSDCCHAGNSQLFINHDGNIYLCPLLQEPNFKIGNILNLNNNVITKIYNRDFIAFDNFDKLKPKNSEKCKKCKVNIFCMGCPAMMYSIKDNENAFKYNCNYMKEKLMLNVW